MKRLKPKDIYLPLGVNPDRFRFLVKRGNIVPETPTSGQGKANTFSPETAMKAGVFFFFEEMGFSIEVSEAITNVIFQNLDNHLYCAFENTDESYWIMYMYNKINFVRSYQKFGNGPYIKYTLEDGKYEFLISEECVNKSKFVAFYNISEILREIADKLKIKYENVPSEA
jgi:hypothetical protein